MLTYLVESLTWSLVGWIGGAATMLAITDWYGHPSSERRHRDDTGKTP
jgi:hypothetical protein